MSRYKPADLERLGASARRQIDLARHAMRCQDKLKEERARTIAKPGKPNKFGAKGYTDADGLFHASKAEGSRWADLKLLSRAGRITNLKHQPVFSIVINGCHIAKYIADAEYIDADGNRIIEDVKSKPTKTALYRLKKKLVECLYSIKITEVT